MLLKTVWFLLVIGCDSGEPVCEENSAATSYVWNGFGYEWEVLSHRLSLVKAMMTETGGAEMGLVGGDWSTGATFFDDPTFRSRAQRIESEHVFVVHGSTTLSLDRDLESVQAANIEVPAGWSQSEASVVLRGVRLNTDVEQSSEYPSDYSPALGYTSSGLSYGVGDATLAEGGVDFIVTGQSLWGPQDREDMNNAMQYAQSELEVGWTVVFHPAQRVDHVLSATEEYPHSPPNSEHPALSGDALAFDVTGKGFTGIRSVTLRLEDQAGTNEGSYWRRIGFELVGSEDGAPSGYAMASNSSLLEEIAVRASVEADVSWFPLEAECSLVQTTLISDTHPVGEASFP